MTELRRLYARMSYGQRVAAAIFSGLIGGMGLFAIALVSYVAGNREKFVADYGSLGSLFLFYLLGGAVAG